jgi:hypothetical protein
VSVGGGVGGKECSTRTEPGFRTRTNRAPRSGGLASAALREPAHPERVLQPRSQSANPGIPTGSGAGNGCEIESQTISFDNGGPDRHPWNRNGHTREDMIL